MNNINIKTTGNKMVIRLNRKGFDSGYLLSLVRRLRLESLAEEANFDESVLEIAKEIDQKWWNENAAEFLKDVRK